MIVKGTKNDLGRISYGTDIYVQGIGGQTEKNLERSGKDYWNGTHIVIKVRTGLGIIIKTFQKTHSGYSIKK